MAIPTEAIGGAGGSRAEETSSWLRLFRGPRVDSYRLKSGTPAAAAIAGVAVAIALLADIVAGSGPAVRGAVSIGVLALAGAILAASRGGASAIASSAGRIHINGLPPAAARSNTDRGAGRGSLSAAVVVAAEDSVDALAGACDSADQPMPLVDREPVCGATGDAGAHPGGAPPLRDFAGLPAHLQAQCLFVEAPVGIAVADRSGRIIRANHALGELLAASAEELAGRRLSDFLSSESADVVADRLAMLAPPSGQRSPVEIRAGERTLLLQLNFWDGSPDRGGTPSPAHSGPAAEGAPSGDNPTAGLIFYFTDITEQKRLEAQVAQSQKMQAIGQLAGGIAHDFNNLLTAMIGFCDLLLLRSRPGDPAFADLMQIKQNANRAANLVRQLLAFSRQQTLQPRLLDVTDVLAELSHLLRRLIGENIALEFDHGRDLGLVKADQGQLEQVIINLAVNARDAMPAGGRLKIRTQYSPQSHPVRRGSETMPAGDYIAIEIADNGAGIAPDKLPRIFEPFFSTKEAGSGTGLGLSTVYGILKQTGGFIFVDSRLGGGTIFTIYLPRWVGAPAARPQTAEAPAPRDLTGSGTIMLVEDDDAVRMFGARALRNKGYRVLEARSGEAALAMMRSASEKIALVITDVIMPQMDGPALVRELRAAEPGTKVIFISGYAEDAFRRSLDCEHGIRFLPKPFNLKQLALMVKQVMSGG